MAMAKIQEYGETFLAVALGNGWYLDETGRKLKPKKENTFGTRNIPPEVRAGFDKLCSIQKDMEKETEKFRKLEEEYSKQYAKKQKELDHTLAAIRRARGILSNKEFLNTFYSALPLQISMDIANKGFIFEEPYGISYYQNALHISKSILIDKWVSENSFIYREYDGQLFLTDDAEKQAAYKNLVKKFSKMLENVKIKPEEYLYLGDKDSLWYGCCYTIPIKEPLTKAYAKKLAKEFARCA